MRFDVNYEIVEDGICNSCKTFCTELLAVRRRTELFPGVCRSCAGNWPIVPSRNDAVLRWHIATSPQVARNLRPRLTKERPLIWIESGNLAELDQIVSSRKVADLDGTCSIAAFAAHPEETDIEEFAALEHLLNELWAHHRTLHIIELGKTDQLDWRPTYEDMI